MAGPDPDRDGVVDDPCPLFWAPRDAVVPGCPGPDTDGDGVPDVADACPDALETLDGVTDLDGCPDLDVDNDGLIGSDDACPQQAHPTGCPPPDNDGDGLPYATDYCPSVPGPAELHGCPLRDQDDDGILDPDDACVGIAEDLDGTQDADGCPENEGESFSPAPAMALQWMPRAFPFAHRRLQCPDSIEWTSGAGDCPTDDADADGVPDASDPCPLYPAPTGCPTPDADRDGIVDSVDLCPSESENRNGVLDDDGCPEWDRDGDGIVDTIDNCPNTYGHIDGCESRDSDRDGVYDHFDRCPATPGHPANEGCPVQDRDGDGYLDPHDRCPQTPEDPDDIANDGCPETDADHDGVLDEEDHCPERPGPPSSDGCDEGSNHGDGGNVHHIDVPAMRMFTAPRRVWWPKPSDAFIIEPDAIRRRTDKVDDLVHDLGITLDAAGYDARWWTIPGGVAAVTTPERFYVDTGAPYAGRDRFIALENYIDPTLLDKALDIPSLVSGPWRRHYRIFVIMVTDTPPRSTLDNTTAKEAAALFYNAGETPPRTRQRITPEHRIHVWTYVFTRYPTGALDILRPHAHAKPPGVRTQLRAARLYERMATR